MVERRPCCKIFGCHCVCGNQWPTHPTCCSLDFSSLFWCMNSLYATNGVHELRHFLSQSAGSFYQEKCDCRKCDTLLEQSCSSAEQLSWKCCLVASDPSQTHKSPHRIPRSLRNLEQRILETNSFLRNRCSLMLATLLVAVVHPRSEHSQWFCKHHPVFPSWEFLLLKEKMHKKHHFNSCQFEAVFFPTANNWSMKLFGNVRLNSWQRNWPFLHSCFK